ncbi:MAG TPA: hypothetical protein VFN10_17145 [Thermoanaerobaculia bacterium]|nr:hypothetical protein [Thermoanaerobaculia bacterium]
MPDELPFPLSLPPLPLFPPGSSDDAVSLTVSTTRLITLRAPELLRPDDFFEPPREADAVRPEVRPPPEMPPDEALPPLRAAALLGALDALPPLRPAEEPPRLADDPDDAFFEEALERLAEPFDDFEDLEDDAPPREALLPLRPAAARLAEEEAFLDDEAFFEEAEAFFEEEEEAFFDDEPFDDFLLPPLLFFEDDPDDFLVEDDFFDPPFEPLLLLEPDDFFAEELFFAAMRGFSLFKKTLRLGSRTFFRPGDGDCTCNSVHELHKKQCRRTCRDCHVRCCAGRCR